MKVGDIHLQSLANGGGTFGNNELPSEGHMVALPVKGDIIPNDLFRSSVEPITNFIQKHRQFLSDPKTYLGTWFNHPQNGGDSNWYLDLAEHVPDRAEALAKARERNEQAIWDLGSNQEIRTDTKESRYYAQSTRDRRSAWLAARVLQHLAAGGRSATES